MYTDIPEWKDYAKWWGVAALVLAAFAGIIGGLLFIAFIAT